MLNTKLKGELSNKFYGLIAPRIIGKEVFLAKQILVLQMFTSYKNNEKLHIALIGDPSSGKSEILKDISTIMPNSKYISSHITKVGLLELFNRCDKGIVAIDEFDKQSLEVRDALLEAMENQEVTVVKHGECHAWKARANLVAAMNPLHQGWDGGVVSFDQFPYHHDLTLWTRFHLFVPFYEVPDEWYPDIAVVHTEVDHPYQRRKIIRNIVIKRKRDIPVVSISPDLAHQIGSYVSVLKKYSMFEKVISPRVIDGAISMCMSKARMDNHQAVKDEDWKYVKDILEKVYLSEEWMNRRELRRML